MSKLLSLVLPGAALLSLVACSSQIPDPIKQAETAKNPSDVPVQVADPSVYPVGPYGYQQLDVIPNLAFVGRRDPSDKTTSSVIRLSDYFQDKSVKVVALLVAAEWCPPCKQEQGELVESYKRYKDQNAGVVYLETLLQNDDAKRTPATLATVDRWTTRPWTSAVTGVTGLKLQFPVVTDPLDETWLLNASVTIPSRVIITTKDMVIQGWGTGYGPGQLEADIQSALDSLTQ